MVCVISRSCDTKGKGRGQMGSTTASLVNASDVQSASGRACEASKTLEGPAATLADGSPGVTSTRTRDLPTPRPLRSRGADMAQSTRGVPRSDSATVISAVKITPASSVSATVPSTLTVA